MNVLYESGLPIPAREKYPHAKIFLYYFLEKDIGVLGAKLPQGNRVDSWEYLRAYFTLALSCTREHELDVINTVMLGNYGAGKVSKINATYYII